MINRLIQTVIPRAMLTSAVKSSYSTVDENQLALSYTKCL